MTFSPRHYHCRRDGNEPTGVVQIDDCLTDLMVRREGIPRPPESILRLAHAEYKHQHHNQDFETIQKRAGFSVFEVVRLLADYVERLGGTIIEP